MKTVNEVSKLNGKEYAMGQHGFARDREFSLVRRTEDEIYEYLGSWRKLRRRLHNEVL